MDQLIDIGRFYKDKNVLITGGLGFLGSNIAQRLVPLGARVIILDSLNSRYGGNYFNLEGVRDKVEVVIGDIRYEKLVDELVRNQSVIFNLAAQVAYINSNDIPFEDLDVNCRGHLVVLEACRKNNRDVKIVFSSSRMVLGKSIQDPITENHPTNPLSLYGIHKLTAEKYHLMYFKDYGIKSVVLRITNPYGERQQIKHNKYSLPGWFMRLAMENKKIQIFGDGNQWRDYIHVDDLVNIFLLVAASEKTSGEIFNSGAGKSYRFREMIETVIKTVGRGTVEYVPWPADYEKIETGDFKVDMSKLHSFVNWQPEIDLEKGVRQMYAYYLKHKDRYLT